MIPIVTRAICVFSFAAVAVAVTVQKFDSHDYSKYSLPHWQLAPRLGCKGLTGFACVKKCDTSPDDGWVKC